MSDKKIPLMELFGPTLQGEGALAGARTFFLRFGLCDYSCTMCDSMHSVDPHQVRENAQWLTQKEILEKVTELAEKYPHCKTMTLSGGNPCIHDLTQLVVGMRDLGLQIVVETQGTKHPEWLQLCQLVTVSPKTPGMGEKFQEDAFVQFIRAVGYHKICVKVVVFAQRDLEVAASIFDLCSKYGVNMKFLSLGNPYPPVLGKEDDLNLKKLLNEHRVLCEDIIADPRFGKVITLPQLHVYWWGNKPEV